MPNTTIINKTKGLTKSKATRQKNEKLTKPSKNALEDQTTISGKNVVPSVQIHIIGSDLPIDDQQRIEAGKSVKFKAEGKAGRAVKQRQDADLSRRKSILIPKPLNVEAKTNETTAKVVKDASKVAKKMRKTKGTKKALGSVAAFNGQSKKNYGKTVITLKDGKAVKKFQKPNLTVAVASKPKIATRFVGQPRPSKVKEIKKAGKPVKGVRDDFIEINLVASEAEVKSSEESPRFREAKNNLTKSKLKAADLTGNQFPSAISKAETKSPEAGARSLKSKAKLNKGKFPGDGGKIVKDVKDGKPAKQSNIVSESETKSSEASPRSLKGKRKMTKGKLNTSSFLSENELSSTELVSYVADLGSIDSKDDLSIEDESTKKESLAFSEITVSYEEDVELENETFDRDLEYESVSISSYDSEDIVNVPHFGDYRAKDKDKIKDNLDDFSFGFIGKLPDIDEISIDLSILRFIHEMEDVISAKAKSTVDDVTLIREEHKREYNYEEEEEEEVVDEEAVMEASESEISMEFQFESISEEGFVGIGKKDEKRQTSDANLFEALIKEEETTFKVEEIDFEALTRQMDKRQLEKDTKEFLEVLIRCVMEVADYVDPDDVLRANLDKVKLFRQLAQLMYENDMEMRVNEFLIKKCVDYYRLQNRFITITPEKDEETLQRTRSRYLEVIDELEKIMAQEAEMERIISQKENTAEEELSKLEHQFKSDLDDLHELIYRTIGRNGKGSDSIMNFIKRQIREMSELRTQISERRSVLIKKEHMMGSLLNKRWAMENFGPNLNVQTYEHIRDDISQLNLTLDDRNTYLYKLHKRYNMNINILAHFRQNKVALFETMKDQLQALQRLMCDKQDKLYYIHLLKRKRIPIQKKIYEMNFQFGLINKPELCADYDQTYDRVLELREIVKGLKDEALSIQKKISAKCPSTTRLGSTLSP